MPQPQMIAILPAPVGLKQVFLREDGTGLGFKDVALVGITNRVNPFQEGASGYREWERYVSGLKRPLTDTWYSLSPDGQVWWGGEDHWNKNGWGSCKCGHGPCRYLGFVNSENEASIEGYRIQAEERRRHLERYAAKLEKQREANRKRKEPAA